MLGVLVGLLHQPSDEGVDHLLDLGEGVGTDLLCEECEAVGVQALALALQEVPDLASDALVLDLQGALQLHQSLGLRRGLSEAQMLLGVAGDFGGGEDFDGLGDGLDLLLPELLLLHEAKPLLGALRLHLAQSLLVGGLQLLLGSERLFVGRLLLRLGGLQLSLLLNHGVLVLNGILQVRDDHAEGVLGVHLVLLSLPELAAEVVHQLLEHADDAAGLELVAVGLRGGVVHATKRGLLVLLSSVLKHAEESSDDTLGLGWQAVTLCQLEKRLGVSRKIAIVVLLLEDSDSTLEGIDALRVVLFLSQEGLVVRFPLLRLCILLGLVGIDLLLESQDLLAKDADVAPELADLGIEALDGGRVCGDLLCELGGLLRAPCLELGEGDLFRGFLLLARGRHVVQEGDDLLHSRDTLLGCGEREHERDERKEDRPDSHLRNERMKREPSYFNELR
mmetsp:Transcript_93885/g.195861  ORF Transcript_93885/g.195861 Transcript_93885/m.195861 type:complete len:449 (-) Transcript_93885:20-1366(-)